MAPVRDSLASLDELRRIHAPAATVVPLSTVPSAELLLT